MKDQYLKYIPLSLFGIYFLKALIFSISYPEAAILAVLGGVACYFQSKNNEEHIKILEDKFTASNKSLEEKVSTSLKSFESRVNEVESIKAQLNAIKVSSLTRPLGNAGNLNAR
jgi:hypothetical protein